MTSGSEKASSRTNFPSCPRSKLSIFKLLLYQQMWKTWQILDSTHMMCDEAPCMLLLSAQTLWSNSAFPGVRQLQKTQLDFSRHIISCEIWDAIHNCSALFWWICWIFGKYSHNFPPSSSFCASQI